MTRRIFTSDLHLGHTLVSELRGFASPEAHDEALAQIWDATVRKDDSVYILGDISINPKRSGAFEWLQARPGIKHLISGNHDEVHPAHSKALKAQQSDDWRNTFATINVFARLKFNGHTVLLSHFPYEGEGGRENITERWSEYRLRDEGKLLLHGHTHDTLVAHASLKGTPVFHVGLDAHGMQLVPESEIVSWVEANTLEER